MSYWIPWNLFFSKYNKNARQNTLSSYLSLRSSLVTKKSLVCLTAVYLSFLALPSCCVTFLCDLAVWPCHSRLGIYCLRHSVWATVCSDHLATDHIDPVSSLSTYPTQCWLTRHQLNGHVLVMWLLSVIASWYHAAAARGVTRHRSGLKLLRYVQQDVVVGVSVLWFGVIDVTGHKVLWNTSLVMPVYEWWHKKERMRYAYDS